MYKILILPLLTFSIFTTSAQTVSTDVEKITSNFKADDVFYQDGGPDTLIYRDSVYYFNKSPIQQFAGYTKLFSDEETALLIKPGSKGYRLRWVIKDNKLYIDNITLVSEGYKYIKNEEGKVIGRTTEPFYLSKEEIKSRLEKFLGAKFDKNNNLLPVNWVKGEFLVKNLNLRDYNSTLVEKQRGTELKRVKFIFDNGGILKSKTEFKL